MVVDGVEEVEKKLQSGQTWKQLRPVGLAKFVASLHPADESAESSAAMSAASAAASAAYSAAAAAAVSASVISTGFQKLGGVPECKTLHVRGTIAAVAGEKAVPLRGSVAEITLTGEDSSILTVSVWGELI